MEENARAAYIISQSAVAIIRALGMQAENKQREHLGKSMAYQEDAFLKIIDEGGIGANSSLFFLRGYWL